MEVVHHLSKLPSAQLFSTESEALWIMWLGSYHVGYNHDGERIWSVPGAGANGDGAPSLKVAISLACQLLAQLKRAS